MQLPATVPFHDDETPLSLASRLAIANGYRSLAEFLSCTDVRAAAIRQCEEGAIEQLSTWSGIPKSRLARYRILGGSASWVLGEATFTKKMRTGNRHRFCPQCVLDDYARTTGRPDAAPYVRAYWTVRLVDTCAVHECPIAEVDASKTGASDFSSFIVRNLAVLRKAEGMPKNAAGAVLARYVASRINGDRSNRFLDKFDSRVAFDLCERLGQVVRRHKAVHQDILKATNDVTLGFSLASQGPEAIEEFVKNTVETTELPNRGFRVFFGSLRSWLVVHRGKPEFREMAELFQGIAERSFPVGIDDVFIFPTKKRLLHSITTASNQWGLTEGIVRKMLEDAGVIERSDLPHNNAVFDAASANAIFGKKQTGMSIRDIHREWRLPQPQLRELVLSGFLPKVEGSGERAGSRIVVHREVFEDLKRKIDGDVVLASELADHVPLWGAASTQNGNMETILQAVLVGKLKIVRCGGNYFTNLWVSRNDLARLRRHDLDPT